MTINVFGGGNSSAPVFPVQRSVRLRSSASAYFNRTLTTPTNQKIWTWSAWVKLGAYTTSYSPLFAAGSSGSAYSAIWLNANALTLFSYSGTNQYLLTTSQVFRDYSGWYHITVAVDTTQATSTNRIKLYINGVQVTAFSASTYPSLNYNDYINSSVAHYIGQFTPALGSIYLDGYLTEVNFIDGQALTPASFGSINSSTGVWQPIKYSGTYGTNGFYLNFQDNSGATATTIGKDSSGNGNNWTPNNISVTAGITYDSMLDVPTLTSGTNANFPTLSPLQVTAANIGVLSNANLSWSCGAFATYGKVYGTMSLPSTGQYYWEVTATSAAHLEIGIIATSDQTTYYPGYSSVGYIYYQNNGNKENNNIASAYGASYTTNDVIGVAFDATAGTLTFYKNNVSQGVAFSGLTGIYSPTLGNASGGASTSASINFGQRPFSYTPPTGFKSLNTYNLPDSTIPNGSTQFAATTYTGTGSSLAISNTVNGKSFTPDFVWVKGRSGATDHALYDSVRGTTKQLESNTTTAETTEATGLTAFDSSGFTVGALAQMNTNAATYVGWQWKAGGTAVTNTSGSISSQVSANPSAGFSVVTYTGTGSNATVGHGLGIAPKMVIVKGRTNTVDWLVYNEAIGNTKYLYLSFPSGAATASTGWNNTTPTSSVFSIGTSVNVNSSSVNYVAYCFSEIAGFSKAFSYTGNGSTDGVFSYLGFKPRMILLKRTDTTGNWYIWDTSRNTYNVVGEELYPNLSNAAATSTDLDLLSNGFKLRNSTAGFNASGGTYIGFAWAENPFKNSLAR